jgi:cytochrome c-type biogenesis protein CcmH
MIFLITCAVLLIVALLFVVLPLWRNAGTDNDVVRDAANLEILRDQSAELEEDLRNGLLTPDAYEQGKRELQARLLDEVKNTEAPAAAPRNPAKTLALLLAVMLPVASILLYAKIGNIRALMPQQQSGSADGFGVLRSEAALQELEKKLEKQPEDPDGWWTLARSYSELQRYPDAVRAFQQLVKLVPNESQVWASYADVSAMNNNRSLLGEPTTFLDKALQLDGKNTFALALSGSAAMERGDYVAAITHWQNLVNLMPPDSPELQMIRDGIQQAREFLAKQKGGKEKLAQLSSIENGTKKPGPGTAVTISGKVSISPALAGKVAPSDTIFVFARAATGPKVPLAVLRKQVKDLPFQFTLDDSMAMQPNMAISGYDQVIVLARVSKSGDAVARSGDLEGTIGAVRPGAKDLNVVIDSTVP